MGHDVFISYAHADKAVADAVCAALERRGVRCWIAPRDVLPGESWGGAIVQAIHQSLAMVVIFSSSSNESHQVIREIERAVNQRLPVMPFRIEAVSPTGDMEYFLSSTHWFDAVTPSLERHIESLGAAAQILLDRSTPPEKTIEPVQRTPKAVPVEIADRNRAAIILFLAIFGLLLAPLGPLAWYLARYQIRTAREGSSGKALRLAKWARVIGIAGTCVLVLYVGLFFMALFQRSKQASTDTWSSESSDILSSDSPLTTEPSMTPTTEGTPEEVEHTTNISTTTVNLSLQQTQNTIGIHNECDEVIDVAIHFQDEKGLWVTKGWFMVKPNETSENIAVTPNSNVYFYADSDTKTWDGAGEAGSIVRSITSQAFEHPDDDPFEYNDARDVSFFHIETGNINYTLPFSCT